MPEPAIVAACNVLANPASQSKQRWHAYGVLLEMLIPHEHIWCQYAHAARFLCGLLEFPKSDLWNEFQHLLRSLTCNDCIAIWSESINKFLRSLSNRFEDHSIEILESEMIKADLDRLRALPIDRSAFELLRRPHLARNRNLNRIACVFLEEHAHTTSGNRAAVQKNGELAPIVYLFCIHPRSVVRSWCQSLVRSRALECWSSDGLISSVVHELLSILSKNQFEEFRDDLSSDLFLYNLPTFWSGLSFLLGVLPEDAHASTASKLLSLRPCVFVERLLTYSRLVSFNSNGHYSILSENVPEDLLSSTLSCLQWLFLNASKIVWEKRLTIGPAIIADIFRKGALYATRSLEALFDAPYLALKIIDIIPIFTMSLPETERHDYISSTVRFLLQIVSKFQSSSQKVAISLKIRVWSAIFKIIRCSFMMNSNAAVVLCSDAWASPTAAFACSDFSDKVVAFLELCSDNVRTALISDAIEAARIALHHDVDNLKKIFIPEESPAFAVDDKHNRHFASYGLWSRLSVHYSFTSIPTQLLEVVLSAIFQAVAIPPSFAALGFDQPHDVMGAYKTIRSAAKTVFQSLAPYPERIKKFAGSRVDIPGLFLLLISYRDMPSFISELFRKEVQLTLKLNDKPNSVNDCLSLLYQHQPSKILELYLQCFNFCTNATIFHSVEKLVKHSNELPECAGEFLGDLYPSIFWLDRLLHLFTDRVAMFSSLESDSLWKLFFILIVSCISFHVLPEFDRTFSALYDMGLTLLMLKPAFLTSFQDFVKSWLCKRDSIPSGTRRRWFQFVRSYIRQFPSEKDTARSIFCRYQDDSIWLYEKGLSDQAQRNYLASLVPSLFKESLNHQSTPHAGKSFAIESNPSSILQRLPTVSVDIRRRDIGTSSKHIIDLSKSPSRTFPGASKTSTELSRSAAELSRAPPSLSNRAHSISDIPSNTESSKTARLRAGFQSLRDDPEFASRSDVIKSINVKPLTTVKSSSDLKRRTASGKPLPAAAESSVSKIEKLPVRSLGHFLNIILDWLLPDVTGDVFSRQLSESMMDPLPKSFNSFIEFRKAFGPLLLEETRAMIQNDYEANRELKPNLIVKQGMDTTPHPSLPGSLLLCSPVSDIPENQRPSESDLLLIWPILDDSDFSDIPSNAVFGLVDCLPNSTRLSIRVTRALSTEPRFRHQLAFLRISSLVTAQRLARALESVARLRLGPSIVLGQQESGALESSFDIENVVLSGLNTSQKTAIMHCICSKDPVVLLQGPPGTGKSTVIIALIKALLQRSVNRNTHQLGQGWMKGEFDSRHILLCAPSNAAADELTSRLVAAKLQAVPESTQYPVIRYGSNVTSDVNAESVSLDRLVSSTQSSQIRSGSQADPNPVFPAGNDRRSVQELRQRFLSEANVLVCTLSGSGSTLIGSIPHAFQVVIVDEAAQAQEIETLIPLQYQCRKLILVGDPRQLPATVLSTVAGKFGLNRSMFERLESVIQPVMLTEQYRMHPEICVFPSKQFYHGRVITAGIERSVPIHNNPFLRPYLFFNIESQDCMVKFSRKNVAEAEFIVQLLLHIDRTVALYGMTRPSVGVVTPYQAQVHEIRYQAQSLMKHQPDVRTIDSFQGQERDIIIISAVRASMENEPYKGLGFVADSRRLNVALTRAKLCCLVVGSARTLSDSVSIWKDLVINAKERNCFMNVPLRNFQGFLQQPNELVKRRPPPSFEVNRQQNLSNKKARPVADRDHVFRGPQHPSPTDQIGNRFDHVRASVSLPDPGLYREMNPDSDRPDRQTSSNFERQPVSGNFHSSRDAPAFPPDRRRRALPGKRFSHNLPDPDAIRRQAMSQSGSDAARRLQPLLQSSPQAILAGRHQTQHQKSVDARRDNVTTVFQKSTATLALDDILGAM